jgi:probable HAF family extracellular repeat protein
MKLRARRLLFCLISLALAVGIARNSPGEVYSLNDLGVLPGYDYGYAASINESGVVAGLSGRTGTGLSRAFLWQQGTMIDLGDLPGRPDWSMADGINNAGEIVGTSGGANGTRGFLWQPGKATDLGTLPGGELSGGRDINDKGQVVGEAGLGGPRPFLWEMGVMTNLRTLSSGLGQGAAYAINNSGQAVGWSDSANSVVRAVMWHNGTTTELGELPGGPEHSTAYGLNDVGQVVGRSQVEAGMRAFLWEDGTMINLGTLRGTTFYTSASAINNHGVVVGAAYPDPFSSVLRGVVWRPGGVAQDLNDLLDVSGAGWVVEEALDINDQGQIVGRGRYNGVSRAVLLTVIPEPSTLLLMLSSLGFCVIGRLALRNAYRDRR